MSARPTEFCPTVQQSKGPVPWFGLPFLWAGAVFLICLSKSHLLLMEPDLQWHIAAGRWMIENRTFMSVDVFSYTFGGRPWISTAWLSQVLFALTYEYGGWPGILLVAAIVTASAFYLIARFISKRHGELWGVLSSALAFPLVDPTITIRPHLLTLPVLVAWTAALMGAAGRGRPPWAALPLMTLWANLHGAFTIGLLVAGVFVLEAIMRAAPADRFRIAIAWFAFASLAVGAACVAPTGIHPFLLTAQLFRSNEALPITHEWQPAALDLTTLLIVMIPLSYVAILAREPWRNTARIGVVVLLTVLTLKHMRFVMFLGVVAPLLGSCSLGRVFRDAAQAFPRPATLSQAARLNVLRGAAAIAAVAVLTALASNPIKPPSSAFPEAALASVPETVRDKPVFNSFQFGGFLALKGIPTFIDGRTDMLFGGGFVTRVAKATASREPGPVATLLQEYKIEWALVAAEEPISKTIPMIDGWRIHYQDDTALVFIKDGK